MGRYPQVAKFIWNEAKNVAGLKVQYVSQADPVLNMKGSDNKVDTVSLKTWTTDQVSQYLKQNLKT